MLSIATYVLAVIDCIYKKVLRWNLDFLLFFQFLSFIRIKKNCWPPLLLMVFIIGVEGGGSHM